MDGHTLYCDLKVFWICWRSWRLVSWSMTSFGYLMSVCLRKSCSLDFSNFFRTISTWCDKLEHELPMIWMSVRQGLMDSIYFSIIQSLRLRKDMISDQCFVLVWMGLKKKKLKCRPLKIASRARFYYSQTIPHPYVWRHLAPRVVFTNIYSKKTKKKSYEWYWWHYDTGIQRL